MAEAHDDIFDQEQEENSVEALMNAK